MGRDDAAGGSDLPAPYRNPWGALRDDLAAVAADLQLRARELWRRNGEGDLWRPRWWPRDLAPLFWPLLGAAALGLLGALLGLLLTVVPLRRWPLAGGAPSAAPAEQQGQPASIPSPAPGLGPTPATPAPDPAAEGSVSRAASAAASDGSSQAIAPGPETKSNPQRIAEVEPGHASEAEGATAPAPVDPPADPLALLLERPEASGLIVAATPQPPLGSLVLQLSPAFARLPEAEQRRRATLWQGWARELGYDHLELRDQRAGLRGRDALVGDGMILFSHQPST
ncbi:MAG: hypothetical protein ACO3FA_04170 [Vulcanococcus sp.]